MAFKERMGLTVLVIEDDVSSARRLARFLEKEGHTPTTAHDGTTGIRCFSETTPDVVLLDYVLPDTNGLAVLGDLTQLDRKACVILMTAHGSIDTAVEAMRLGAADYLQKPLDLEAVSLKLSQMQELLGLRSDLDYLLDQDQRSREKQSFIGDHPRMKEVREKVRVVAETDNTTVLVTGPSGTGKEVVARAVHSQSARSKRPLMQIDCTAIPLSLMESELFGHERGAFSGADRMKKGLLELADGGTLLLDEIGDMALDLQAKLLRVLQERQFRRVGGTRDLRFDVRVIAATNQDLARLCDEGRFRRDLLYRLKVFEIELPPLATRGKDILLLARAFLQEFGARFRKRLVDFTPRACEALLGYGFPGNVRELRNLVEQAAILAEREEVDVDVLNIPSGRGPARPPETLSPRSGPPDSRLPAHPAPRAARPTTRPPRSSTDPRYPPLRLDALGEAPLEEAERQLIKQALIKSGGNKKQAAELLGISRFALQRRLDKLALAALDAPKV